MYSNIWKKLFFATLLQATTVIASADGIDYYGEEDNVYTSYPYLSSSRSDEGGTIPDYGSTAEGEPISAAANLLPDMIESYAAHVDALYDHRADELYYNYVGGATDGYKPLDYCWDWEQARLNLETFNKEKKIPEIANLVTLLDNFIRDKLFENKQPKWEAFKDMRNHRSNLDCLLTSQTVTNNLKNLTRYFFDETTVVGSCTRDIQQMWKYVQTGSYSECDIENVYIDLNYITLILNTLKFSQTIDTSDANIRTKSELVQFLSSPDIYPFFNNMLCYDVEPPCKHADDNILEFLCSQQLDLYTLDRFMSDMNSQSHATNLYQLHKIHMKLGKISNDLMKIDKLEPSTRATAIALSMLDSYIGIMDQTLDKGQWRKMSRKKAENGFKESLEQTDMFVGGIADVVHLGDLKERSQKIDKKSIALQLLKFKPEAKHDNVNFTFGGAEINTRFMDGINDTVTVYAVHYNSWEYNPGNNHSTLNKRMFAGDGGIISLSAKVGDEGKSVPVTYKIKFNDAAVNSSRDSQCLSCEFFNLTSELWESTGCRVSGVVDDAMVCDCDHTTNFGAFMSPVKITLNLTESQTKIINVFTYAGSGMSALALVIALWCFNAVHNTVHNDRLRAHVNLCVALLVVHVTQLFVDLASTNDESCLAVAIITHYFLLSAFAWMFVEGIFLYLYVVQVFIHTGLDHKKWMYSTGWVVPLLITVVACVYFIPRGTYLAETTYGNYGCDDGQFLYPPLPVTSHDSCFLSVSSGAIWTFIGPAVLVILFNLIILVKVVQVLVKVSNRSHQLQPYQAPGSSYTNKTFSTVKEENSPVNGNSPQHHPTASTSSHSPAHASKIRNNRSKSTAEVTTAQYLQDAKSAVKGAMVLLPILGIPWILGMFVNTSFTLMIIFLVLNSTQGVAIFIVYCLLNDEIRRPLYRVCERFRLHYHGRRRTSSMTSLKSARTKLNSAWRSRSTTLTNATNGSAP